LRRRSRRIGKWKFENGNANNEIEKIKVQETAALQVVMEEIVSYCLLADSPVTMGKVERWLQSSQEPSYIFAS
jgi:hypothetical protein